MMWLSVVMILKTVGEKCFNYCGKRKIMSMSNMANMLVDPKTVQKGNIVLHRINWDPIRN